MARGWQRLDNIPNRPGAIFYPSGAGRRRLERHVLPHEIGVHEVQSDSVRQVLGLFEKALVSRVNLRFFKRMDLAAQRRR